MAVAFSHVNSLCGMVINLLEQILHVMIQLLPSTNSLCQLFRWILVILYILLFDELSRPNRILLDVAFGLMANVSDWEHDGPS